jgi:UrcA family protein
MRTKSLFVGVLVLGSFSMYAAAEPIEYATVVAQSDAREKTVSYGDLNLQRHEGVATLYARITRAANLVCSDPNERMPQVASRIRQCAADATSRAVAEVGVPALAALDAQQSKKASTPLLARRLR